MATTLYGIRDYCLVHKTVFNFFARLPVKDEKQQDSANTANDTHSTSLEEKQQPCCVCNAELKSDLKLKDIQLFNQLLYQLSDKSSGSGRKKSTMSDLKRFQALHQRVTTSQLTIQGYLNSCLACDHVGVPMKTDVLVANSLIQLDRRRLGRLLEQQTIGQKPIQWHWPNDKQSVEMRLVELIQAPSSSRLIRLPDLDHFCLSPDSTPTESFNKGFESLTECQDSNFSEDLLQELNTRFGAHSYWSNKTVFASPDTLVRLMTLESADSQQLIVPFQLTIDPKSGHKYLHLHESVDSSASSLNDARVRAKCYYQSLFHASYTSPNDEQSVVLTTNRTKANKARCGRGQKSDLSSNCSQSSQSTVVVAKRRLRSSSNIASPAISSLLTSPTRVVSNESSSERMNQDELDDEETGLVIDHTEEQETMKPSSSDNCQSNPIDSRCPTVVVASSRPRSVEDEVSAPASPTPSDSAECTSSTNDVEPCSKSSTATAVIIPLERATTAKKTRQTRSSQSSLPGIITTLIDESTITLNSPTTVDKDILAHPSLSTTAKRMPDSQSSTYVFDLNSSMETSSTNSLRFIVPLLPTADYRWSDSCLACSCQSSSSTSDRPKCPMWPSCSSRPTELDQSSDGKPIFVQVKPEYLGDWGLEELSERELIEAWFNSTLRRDCDIVRVRLRVDSGKLVWAEYQSHRQLIASRSDFNHQPGSYIATSSRSSDSRPRLSIWSYPTTTPDRLSSAKRPRPSSPGQMRDAILRQLITDSSSPLFHNDDVSASQLNRLVKRLRLNLDLPVGRERAIDESTTRRAPLGLPGLPLARFAAISSSASRVAGRQHSRRR